MEKTKIAFDMFLHIFKAAAIGTRITNPRLFKAALYRALHFFALPLDQQRLDQAPCVKVRENYLGRGFNLVFSAQQAERWAACGWGPRSYKPGDYTVSEFDLACPRRSYLKRELAAPVQGCVVHVMTVDEWDDMYEIPPQDCGNATHVVTAVHAFPHDPHNSIGDYEKFVGNIRYVSSIGAETVIQCIANQWAQGKITAEEMMREFERDKPEILWLTKFNQQWAEVSD